MQTFKDKFRVVAISETWISEEKELLDGLDGYQMFAQNRYNKRGGSVALFVRSGLKCKVIVNMTFSIDNLMECLSVEIEGNRSKNMFISCVYRTPGSCIDKFSKTISEMLEKHNEKFTFVCGDFNIDLLKSNEHTKTSEFVNTMFSLGFYPLILKPTRITKDSASLIDNIFINKSNVKTKSGLLVTDITDHLPVFTVLDMLNELHLRMGKQNLNLVKLKLPGAMEAMKIELLNYNWQNVYVKDVNDSYNVFLEIFTRIYDNHRPLKKCKQKQKNRLSPWMTKSLEKSCKKKNKLYMDVIKCPNKEKEEQYKKYKNRLTTQY